MDDTIHLNFVGAWVNEFVRTQKNISQNEGPLPKSYEWFFFFSFILIIKWSLLLLHLAKLERKAKSSDLMLVHFSSHPNVIKKHSAFPTKN